MAKSTKPSLSEAFEKEMKYKLIVLKYIWPSFAIFFAGIIIFMNFEEYITYKLVRLEWYFFPLIFFAVIVNVIYYKRMRNNQNK